MKYQFPEDFLWGTSTAAAQIETASEHNWKGVRSRDGHRMVDTTRHEQKRSEDAELIARFGTVYRCGVDWARLQTAPFAAFDSEVVAEYKVFFDLLQQRGMKILFVIHHFTNPLWFERSEGWLNSENTSAFINYAEQCLEHFSDQVWSWNTFNEPNVYAFNGYLSGQFPPFRKSLFKMRKVLQNMGAAHKILYKRIKNFHPHQPIGISYNTAWFEGLNWLGKIRASAAHWAFNRYASKFFEQSDYWGISYYAYIPFKSGMITEIDHPGKLASMGIPHDKMWGYRPEGLFKHLKYFWKKYKKPILITENGVCTADPAIRVKAINDYLKLVHQAIEEGVEVMGYIHWSTWDNFEWHLGPTYQFGLYSIEPETKDRIPTIAADYYAKVCKENKIIIEA